MLEQGIWRCLELRFAPRHHFSHIPEVWASIDRLVNVSTVLQYTLYMTFCMLKSQDWKPSGQRAFEVSIHVKFMSSTWMNLASWRASFKSGHHFVRSIPGWQVNNVLRSFWWGVLSRWFPMMISLPDLVICSYSSPMRWILVWLWFRGASGLQPERLQGQSLVWSIGRLDWWVGSFWLVTVRWDGISMFNFSRVLFSSRSFVSLPRHSYFPFDIFWPQNRPDPDGRFILRSMVAQHCIQLYTWCKMCQLWLRKMT